MTETTVGTQPEVNLDVEMSSPGAALSRLRVARNLSIAEVAHRLKYGIRQIDALERDDFARLPGLTFIRGMIRSYAKSLDVDPEDILHLLDRRHVPDAMTVDLRASRIPFPDGRKRQATRLYALLSILILLGAALIGYELHSGNRILPWWEPAKAAKAESIAIAGPAETAVSTLVIESKADVAPVAEGNTSIAASEASPSAEAAPLPAVPASKRITLHFDKESWVEIKQGDGKVLHSKLNPAGTRQFISGFPPFSLVIGNASSVRLFYNEQPVDLRPYFKVDVARFTLE